MLCEQKGPLVSELRDHRSRCNELTLLKASIWSGGIPNSSGSGHFTFASDF